jgi:toxin ParE1/3/4
MSRVIRKLPDARRDLVEIADYLAPDDLAPADRFLEAADQTFEFLASMSEIGSQWESENPALAGLRVWPVRGFKKYLVFYRSTADSIEIVRVLHASRDIESILDTDS